MCEMVFRGRQERLAHVEAIAKMIATVFNTSSDRAFSGILSEYASEVYQQTYDTDALQRKIWHRRQAQARIQARRRRDEDLLKRLDRMGDFYDQKIANKDK